MGVWVLKTYELCQMLKVIFVEIWKMDFPQIVDINLITYKIYPQKSIQLSNNFKIEVEERRSKGLPLWKCSSCPGGGPFNCPFVVPNFF